MAQAAVALGLDSLAGVGAHSQALARLEALEEQMDSARQRRKSNGMVRRAVKVWRRGDITRAALATALAAKIYGLRILKRDVADAKHNTTRFVLLSRKPKWAKRGKPVVTTFLFEVRNIPAALYKALGGFATNGVNMTKLESYMVNGEFTATQFLADVDGHPEEPPLARALEELGFFSHEVRILGVYPAHPFRRLAG